MRRRARARIVAVRHAFRHTQRFMSMLETSVFDCPGPLVLEDLPRVPSEVRRSVVLVLDELIPQSIICAASLVSWEQPFELVKSLAP